MQVNEFECNACDYKVYSFDQNVHGHGCQNCKINYGFSLNSSQNFHSRYNTISDIDDVLDKINEIEKKQEENQRYVEKKIEKLLKCVKKMSERQDELIEHSESVIKKQKKIIKKQNKLDDNITQVTDQYLMDDTLSKENLIDYSNLENEVMNSPRSRRNSIVDHPFGNSSQDWSLNSSPRSTDPDEIIIKKRDFPTPPTRRSTVKKDLGKHDFVPDKSITTGQSSSCGSLSITKVQLANKNDKISSSLEENKITK